MQTHETAIFLAILTAAAVLLALITCFVLTIATYQRKKNQLSHEQICSGFLLLEKEQSRIALDLHDDIGNTLSAIRLQLEMLEPGGEVALAKQIGKVVDRVRQISFNMLPEMLEKQGLQPALEKLVAAVPIRAYISGDNPCIGKEKELQVFRIVQEWLGNTLKHANASEVNIVLKQEGTVLTVRYRDNGIGFDRNEAHKGKGAGLSNIQARAVLLNAAVYLVSAVGEGASWQLEIPLS